MATAIKKQLVAKNADNEEILICPITSTDAVVNSEGKSVEELINEAGVGGGGFNDVYAETSINLGRKAETTVGENSVAIGKDNEASGTGSVTLGNINIVQSNYSLAEGYNNTIETVEDNFGGIGASHAEGKGNKIEAGGYYHHIEGERNTIQDGGYASHVEGYNNTVIGSYTHVEGYENTVTPNAYCVHVEGQRNKVLDGYGQIHVEGFGHELNAMDIDSCHVEGKSNYILENAVAAHVEGRGTKVSGEAPHVEGYASQATGLASHAEGYTTKSTSQGSHSEGYYTEANALASHAEGTNTKATNYAGHSEGYHTIASGQYQHVQGQYNIEDTENKYAHIVGGGFSDTDRKNIHTLDWKGNAVFTGDVIDGNGYSIATIKALAEGASSAIVLNTYDDLETYIADENNIAKLTVGQTFLIKELDVPDYWWDGIELVELEGRKIDLDEYAKVEDVPTKMSELENDIGYITTDELAEILRDTQGQLYADFEDAETIDTGASENVVSTVNYSTEEQKVGTWVDGKSLYQKTIYIDSLQSSSGMKTYNHNIENIDVICDIRGTVIWKSSGVASQLMNAQMVDNAFNYPASFYYTVNKIGINLTVGTDRSGCCAYVTLQYTKTTDIV